MVECGHDVVIFLDSITRLARAYNTVSPASAKQVSMNPVVSHCTVLLGTSNSCINVGRAEIISVWLRMSTNEPIIRVMTMAVVLAGVVLLELAGWWSRPQRWPARNCVTSIIKSRFLG